MEWLIAAGTVLGSVLTTAAVVFRRSLEKARRGGQARVAHVEAEAERIRAAANRRLREAETLLPRLRVEVESARRAGTLHRTADDLRARQSAAEERARRAAQSFNTALDREGELLRALRETGLLRDTAAGPVVDASRSPAAARAEAAVVGRHLQELEWYRVNGHEDGISGPLRAPAFTEERATALREGLDRAGRVDETWIRERTRGAVSGRNLLTDSPRSMAEAVRGRKGLQRRTGAAGDRGADARREAVRREEGNGHGLAGSG
ncbi:MULTISPECIES: hypothetical protein [Nocardiopsidaceae]|uniref:Secreted protein n=1 Tax=Streptomonospora nanhaiensis TaxID=1323731 RepID=A0ABY6YNF9_9ACTN|nr:hypothetical protein [Streptomonospora nanhaiensis]WAE73919.1 hypothetical protein OUQ99_01970 [Streptomonospora nanhaiensis]